MAAEHLPVMVREALEILSPKDGETHIDATAGLGGHSEEILKMIGRNGKVVAIDRDAEALERISGRISDDRLVLLRGPFSQMETLTQKAGIAAVDGILMDLGVSMMQLREMDRGFSFNSSERLDMRMDRSSRPSAHDVVNSYSEEKLASIIREFGEEFRASRIARAIVRSRAQKSIDTCAELAEIVAAASGGRGRTHPATRTFQALRIEVNREMEELREGLAAALRLLVTGGRLCVISYHSLEDRMVKNFIRENAKAGTLNPLSKKPLVPETAEVRANPSSRSAKMRGALKL